MDKAPEIKMQALKTHLGATGGQVRAGSPYTLQSEMTAAEHVRLGIGERLSPEAQTEEEAAAAGETDDLAQPWPLSLTPRQYLDKYGDDAKHSKHAQAVIDRGEGGQ